MNNDDTLNEYENENRVQFGKRFAAHLIDIVVNIFLGASIGGLLGTSLSELFFPDSSEVYAGEEYQQLLGSIDNFAELVNTMTAAMAGIFIVTFLMFIMEGVLGQSLGKMILKITNANQDGTYADAKSLWIRASLKYVYIVLALISGIAGISVLGNLASLAGFVMFVGCFFVLGEKRQAFHDMISKTAVFSK